MLYSGHVCKDVCRKGTQCIPSHASNAKINMWDRPAVATKKRDAVNTEIGAKNKLKKKILKTSKKNDGIAFHYHKMGHPIDFANTPLLQKKKLTGKG